ncbi:hypothetical protein F0U61_48390 [Archangium violaceum]|uniref:hypothetical protein n=1 Tax=Archangium violaceum TaxID=83451 RepID=UPI002B2907D8|nr:hypothetical protein F0U61_48390 [Archangium violaceum]
MKDLRQVYATRFEDSDGDVFHALWVMKKDGRSVLLTRDNLLTAPFTSEIVLELERRLEEHLGIQDAPVSVLGELRAH